MNAGLVEVIFSQWFSEILVATTLCIINLLYGASFQTHITTKSAMKLHMKFNFKA